MPISFYTVITSIIFAIVNIKKDSLNVLSNKPKDAMKISLHFFSFCFQKPTGRKIVLLA